MWRRHVTEHVEVAPVLGLEVLGVVVEGVGLKV